MLPASDQMFHKLLNLFHQRVEVTNRWYDGQTFQNLRCEFNEMIQYKMSSWFKMTYDFSSATP